MAEKEVEEQQEIEQKSEEETIIDGIKYIIQDRLVLTAESLNSVGFVNDNGEVEFFEDKEAETIEKDIPNKKKDERLHREIYEKNLNVGDLLLIFYESDSEVLETILEIESIDMEQNKIKLFENDSNITELLLNDESHVILKTDDYDIIDIEKIVVTDENMLEDLDLRLTKDLIKDIVFDVAITDDKSYTDNEKKEELISELISLLNAYNNTRLIKEITDMSEYYLDLIRECLNKKIDNKETLTFITNIINDNKFNLPSFLKPIVSAKRNLYGSITIDPLTGQEQELDNSIIRKEPSDEPIEIKKELEKESVKNFGYKKHLNVDMHNNLTNYQFNDNNIKFKTKYEGEYMRDCIDTDSCYGAIVTENKDGDIISLLHTNYSYDNVKTRNKLIYRNLIAETTKEEILKDSENINMVGMMLFPVNYLYQKNNLSLKNNLFSLEEITAYNKLVYSYEIFKNRLKKEQTLTKQISIDTNETGLDELLTYYLFNTDTINLDSLGTILKNNLPSKMDIINSIDSSVYDKIYDINNFERLLNNYDIKFKDLDTVLKQIVIENIQDNINIYNKSYEKLAKPKKVESLNINVKKLTDEERSSKSLKYILGLINVRDKYTYLRKYIDLFLRPSKSLKENNNYFYNKYSDEKSLCKHYEYLIDENKFDSLLNIWKSDTIKDGYICCKNCGEYLCPEGFSPLQGFSDGKPVNTNEKLEDESVDEQTKTQLEIKELINEIQKIFRVNLNIKDLESISGIVEKVNINDFFELRYKKKGIDDSNSHPYMKKYKKEKEDKIQSAKTKKEKNKIKEKYASDVEDFKKYIRTTSLSIIILYLIPFFVQTAIPSYNMKVELKFIDEEKLKDNKFINWRSYVNDGMLSFIESTLRKKCNKSSIELWKYIEKLLNESTQGLNDIRNNIYDALIYLSENYLITKRLDNYRLFLSLDGDSYYIKDTWSSYRPINTNDMILNINKKVNDDKTFTETDKKMENNALLNEIKHIKDTEKYKELDIEISEFMNNESYKRLLKYSVQLYGKTKKSVRMIDLLINRLIKTLDNSSLETFFKKIGWGGNIGTIKDINYNELKQIILQDIPELYKKDKESVRTFIHINQNNFDLRILSSRVDMSKIYDYKGVDIYPLDSYTDLENKKSKILDKIFNIYCFDEFGNIIVKSNTNYLDYLLLDFNESVVGGNNCDDKKKFNKNEGNFLKYLETLRNKNKLQFNEDNFKEYILFYEKELIKQIEINNLEKFEPNKHLLNFINKNNYLDESNSDKEIFENIIDIFDDPDYTLNKSTESKIKEILSSIIDSTEKLSDELFDTLETTITNYSLDPIFTEQLKRIESYYNLKVIGVGGVKVGQIKASTITKRMKDLFNNIIDNDDKDDLSEIIEIKINYIKNIYSILGRLKNKGEETGTRFHSNIPYLWKISKNNKDELKEFLKKKEFLLHEDVFGEKNVYEGFYKYENTHYFVGLLNYIDGYKENINDLIGINSDKYALKKSDINYLINFVLVFILNKINEYIRELIIENEGEENEINQNAIQLFQELEKNYLEDKQEMVKECSSLLLDLVQNILEEHNDVNYLHANKEIEVLNKQMSKQKEREKQFLVTELTGQSNEQRGLTLEKQKAGLSNWFDNLSKQNEEYKKSEQYKIDSEEERLKRFKALSESFTSEKEVYEKQGLNYDDLIKQQIEESSEDKGYDDGKDKVEEEIEGNEDENEELDGYDN